MTGGTGTFGNYFLDWALPRHKIRVYSRDELKQSELRHKYGDHPNLRLLIGDVRDYDRLRRAAENVAIIIHAAALKQVPSCEYNPFETVKTNVLGTQNVVDAALDNEVPRALLISSDKAVSPINTYGASKMLAEKIMVAANSYAGGHNTRFSAVRYGNVQGSRGSVHEVFAKQVAAGQLPTVTDERATRFFFEPLDAIRLVKYAMTDMRGGEIFVPKMRARRIIDVAREFADELVARPQDINWVFVGPRPGEKLHETLITEEEARRTEERTDCYVIWPQFNGHSLPEGFSYTSECA